MKKFLTLLLTTAALAVAGNVAAAAPVSPRTPAAVQAYRQEIRRECASGVFVPKALNRRYAAARASGYRGDLLTPQAAEQRSEQAP